MAKKRKGAAAEVVDMATTAVRTRARMAAASSAGTVKSSDGGSNVSFKLLRNDSTCSQAKSSAGRNRDSAARPVAPPPSAVAEEDARCLSSSSDDEAWVSCCSSYGSSEMEKKLKDEQRFADLKDENELSEADCDSSTSSPSPFTRERREMESRGEEETDSMNSSSLDKAPEPEPVPEPNPPERSNEEIQSSVLDEEPEGLLNTNDKPERLSKINMPSQFDIEEFFAVFEAENLSELEHYKRKYNFDFVAEEPLEGRFEWHKVITPAKEYIK